MDIVYKIKELVLSDRIQLGKVDVSAYREKLMTPMSL